MVQAFLESDEAESEGNSSTVDSQLESKSRPNKVNSEGNSSTVDSQFEIKSSPEDIVALLSGIETEGRDYHHHKTSVDVQPVLGGDAMVQAFLESGIVDGEKSSATLDSQLEDIAAIMNGIETEGSGYHHHKASPNFRPVVGGDAMVQAFLESDKADSIENNLPVENEESNRNRNNSKGGGWDTIRRITFEQERNGDEENALEFDEEALIMESVVEHWSDLTASTEDKSAKVEDANNTGLKEENTTAKVDGGDKPDYYHKDKGASSVSETKNESMKELDEINDLMKDIGIASVSAEEEKKTFSIPQVKQESKADQQKENDDAPLSVQSIKNGIEKMISTQAARPVDIEGVYENPVLEERLVFALSSSDEEDDLPALSNSVLYTIAEAGEEESDRTDDTDNSIEERNDAITALNSGNEIGPAMSNLKTQMVEEDETRANTLLELTQKTSNGTGTEREEEPEHKDNADKAMEERKDAITDNAIGSIDELHDVITDDILTMSRSKTQSIKEDETKTTTILEFTEEASNGTGTERSTQNDNLITAKKTAVLTVAPLFKPVIVEEFKMTMIEEFQAVIQGKPDKRTNKTVEAEASKKETANSPPAALPKRKSSIRANYETVDKRGRNDARVGELVSPTTKPIMKIDRTPLVISSEPENLESNDHGEEANVAFKAAMAEECREESNNVGKSNASFLQEFLSNATREVMDDFLSKTEPKESRQKVDEKNNPFPDDFLESESDKIIEEFVQNTIPALLNSTERTSSPSNEEKEDAVELERLTYFQQKTVHQDNIIRELNHQVLQLGHSVVSLQANEEQKMHESSLANFLNEETQISLELKLKYYQDKCMEQSTVIDEMNSKIFDSLSVPIHNNVFDDVQSTNEDLKYRLQQTEDHSRAVEKLVQVSNSRLMESEKANKELYSIVQNFDATLKHIVDARETSSRAQSLLQNMVLGNENGGELAAHAYAAAAAATEDDELDELGWV